MDGLFRLRVISQAAQPGRHHVLQVRLARVDHVVHARPVPELVLAGVGSVRAHPEHAPVGVSRQRPVVKVLAQQTELPELIGDVLAHVSHRAIGAHDHFALFGKSRHHPAAGVLAFRLQINGLPLLELFEGRSPELQVQNLAFAWQHIVLHVEPQHGLQMRLHYGVRHQVRHSRQLAIAGLDGVQRLAAPGE